MDRKALTLLELMVVLVILTVVATVTVQSLQPQIDSERVQAASQLLQEIESSVVGPVRKYQVDGTPLISGFVSDVGRLPSLSAQSNFGTSQIDLSSGESQLAGSNLFAELWDESALLASQYPFQFRSGPNQPVDYSEIQLPCGWRGPYMRLPMGTDNVIDPWGESPEPTFNEKGQINGVGITIPESLADQNQGLVTDLSTGIVQVTGKVLVDNPEESSIQTVMLIPSPDSSLTTLAVIDDESLEASSFSFSNVPIGLRALIADVDGKRHVKYLHVPHEGANVVFDLRQTVN